MKLAKKITALFLAGILSLSISAVSFAETSTGDSAQTSSAESQQISEAESSNDEKKEESGVSEAYQPIDISDYQKWDGKSNLKKGQKYYIDSTVKVGKDKLLNIPAETDFVVRDGASLLVYVGANLMVGGNLIVEPGGKLTVSTKTTIHTNGSMVCYGAATFTKSSIISLSSKMEAASGSMMVFAGKVNIYKDGQFKSHGRVTFAESSQSTVTGILEAFADAQTFVKGDLSITLSGMATFGGYLSITNNVNNSGVITLSQGLNFYKYADYNLVMTNSGRFFDERSSDTPEPDETPEPDDNNNDREDEEKIQIKGIDVSRYNGNINWEKVKASGIEFAIIRASIGLESDTYGQDRRFAYNASEAYNAGIKVGAYHYLKAMSVEEARKEAKYFISVIEPYTLEYPVMLDFEDPAQAELDKKTLTSMAKVFLDELRDAGYYPMLYTYKNWIKDHINIGELSEYDVAVAEWADHPTYNGNMGIWQYTSKGHVSGITGDVDLDISYKDYAKIIKDGGYNNMKK